MRSLAIVFCLISGVASAQTIVTPRNVVEPEVGCLVKGLNPNGDGFLAVRTGPGTRYPKIAELHNGDAVFLAAACQGRWCYFEGASQGGRETRLRGWIYDKWCEFYP